MSVDDLLEKGSRALDEGDSKAAVQFFMQALDQQESAETWLYLAEAQIDSGLFSKAHSSLARGLSLEPENIDLLLTQGDLYLEENRNSEAITVYQRAIDQDPREIDAWVSKAMAYVNIDDLEAAESTCREALRIAPDSAFACNALGDICAEQGRSEEAMQYYQKASVLDPEDPQPCLSLADLYYDAENLEQAEEYCRKGLKLDAGLPSAYLTLGYICLDQDRSEEAVENFQQFLRLEKSPAAKQLRDEVAAVIEGLK